MKNRWSVMLAAGLGVLCAGSGRADIASGQSTLHPHGNSHTYSQSSASSFSSGDLGLVSDLYRHHIAQAAVLSAHRNHYAEQDPALASRFSSASTEHLIMASRARQLVRQMGGDVAMLDMQSQQVQYMGPMGFQSERFSTAADPRVREMAEYSRMLHDQNAAFLRAASNGVEEQVAGFRAETGATGDAAILQRFYGAQMNEAKILRAQSERVRSHDTNLADHFIGMARDHEEMASRAEQLLRARGGTLPNTIDVVISTQPADNVIRHEWQHHNEALNMLSSLYLQAQDPEVRSLLNEAMNGTTQHLEILTPHIEAIDED